MTEVKEFEQGHSYIVKDREGFKFFIKVLLITDTYYLVEWIWQGTTGAHYDLQKFKSGYQIVEEVA